MKRIFSGIIFALFFGSLASNILVAAEKPQPYTQVVLIGVDDIMFPVVAEIIPIPPVKVIPPALLVSVPQVTSSDSVTIKVSGEAGASIYVNNQKAGTIGSTGTAFVTLDTSGGDEKKIFDIVLQNSAGEQSTPLHLAITKENDTKYDIVYKGLAFYQHDLPSASYRLPQLSDSEFNALTDTQKRTVADKLLSTLFFGYPEKTLTAKIDSGTFLSDIRESLKLETIDREALESYISDETYFRQYSRWAEPQAIKILTRFYAMDQLDRYYFNNWTAYILTQTIMFSPAYELDTTHTPDIGNVYNRLVTMLNDDAGLRFITYTHMVSTANWRRFRSPEDNGREMIEIFLFDEDDAHVPLAAKALQNWHLNEDGDTLEVGLGENTQPLQLFGTTVKNGDDFYRELVKSAAFTQGAARRLVDFFFTDSSQSKKDAIVTAIVQSHPETWKDILGQLIFSKAYLLENERAKSAEELFYSLAKKISFRHRTGTFYDFKEALEEMHQASMKYKLGKIERVPLDTLSFAVYHKYIRETLMVRRSNPAKEESYNAWDRTGFGKELIAFGNFSYDENDPQGSLEHFIQYLFRTVVGRDAFPNELAVFKNHMLGNDEEGNLSFPWAFDMFATNNDPERQARYREDRKAYIARIVLDYISRLEELYIMKEVR